jgi:hypothetical protein
MPLPELNLDDRTYTQLVDEVRARIPVHTPEWSNFNDSDPGMTLVQLFAFMTENLLYRSNRIPQANRLKFLRLLGVPLQPATPGRGLVVIRHDRGPIQALPLDAGLEVRAGKTPFRTRTGLCVLPLSAAVFTKQDASALSADEAAQYEELYAAVKEGANDQLQFYRSIPLEAPETGKLLPVVDLALGGQTIDRSVWLALLAPENVPPAAVRSKIANQTLSLGIYPAEQLEEGRVLEPQTAEPAPNNDSGLLFEIAAPAATADGSLPAPRYVPLNVLYADNVLDAPGIVHVALPDYPTLAALDLWDFDPNEEGIGGYPPLIEDKSLLRRLVAWVRVRLPQPPGEEDASAGKAQISWIGVNAARVVQGLPVVNERLGVANGGSNQLFKVANTPVIAETIPGGTPGARGATETFVLRVEGEDGRYETWRRTDDLLAAGPDDGVYLLDPEAGIVQFGDGLRGRRPPQGRVIAADYEYGGGPEGKVAIAAISQAPQLPGGYKVENPVPTWGAAAGETVADGERNIARYIRHRDRLVTEGDFRDITRRTPGVEIGRVEVLPLFNPRAFNPLVDNPLFPGAVTVLVVPKHTLDVPQPPRPDRLFLDRVCAWINPRRLLTTEVHVRGPEYVLLGATVGIVTLPGYGREAVFQEVKTALKTYLSPLVGGLPAGGADTDAADAAGAALTCNPLGSGWTLGMEVRVQDLAAVAVRVPGVRYVTGIQLGVQKAGLTALHKVETQRMAGIQLPWLAHVDVREGDPADLGLFTGQGPDAAPVEANRVPVPVVAKKC